MILFVIISTLCLTCLISNILTLNFLIKKDTVVEFVADKLMKKNNDNTKINGNKFKYLLSLFRMKPIDTAGPSYK